MKNQITQRVSPAPEHLLEQNAYLLKAIETARG